MHNITMHYLELKSSDIKKVSKVSCQRNIIARIKKLISVMHGIQ